LTIWKPKRKDVTKLKERALQLRKEGLTYAEIGKKIGRSTPLVSFWLNAKLTDNARKWHRDWQNKKYKTDKKFRKKMIDANIRLGNWKYKNCETFRNKRLEDVKIYYYTHKKIK
jgi:hypothetical protein